MHIGLVTTYAPGLGAGVPGPDSQDLSVEKDEHLNFLVCPSLPRTTAAAVRVD